MYLFVFPFHGYLCSLTDYGGGGEGVGQRPLEGLKFCLHKNQQLQALLQEHLKKIERALTENRHKQVKRRGCVKRRSCLQPQTQAFHSRICPVPLAAIFSENGNGGDWRI